MFWNSASSLFRNGGANYMPVSALESAAAWYREKFGLKPVNIELDDGEGCLALGFSKEECLFVLGPQGKSSEELIARLFSPNLKKAREHLVSRGVQADDIQQDGQGTQFFAVRDIEGTRSRFPRSRRACHSSAECRARNLELVLDLSFRTALFTVRNLLLSLSFWGSAPCRRVVS